MIADYYLIREIGSVLLARPAGPRLAASQFTQPGGVVLSSPADLRDLAIRRKKLLHVAGTPLRREEPLREPELVPA
jgi:hypothetical protein